MTTHSTRELCPFALDHIEIEITFNFTQGAPAQGPSYSSGGQPAEPDDIEFVSVIAINNQLDKKMQEMLVEWSIDFLEDEGYDRACELAHEDIYKGPED
jgi:hypothetical protein